MLSSHIMVVLIVTIVMVASVLRARYKAVALNRQTEDPDTVRAREEIKALRDRIAVLERIATEKEHSLAQEIERLRDK